MSEEVKVLKDKLAALEGELRESLVEQALQRAAEAARAVDPAQVGVLFRQEYGLGVDEERQVRLVDAEGQPLLDESGQPLPLTQTVSAWLEKNPHLVRPVSRSGAGSPPGAGAEEPGFTPEQLADPAFYRANRERIHKFFNRR